MKLIDLSKAVVMIFACQPHITRAAAESYTRFDVTTTYSIHYSNNLPARTIGTIKNVLQVLFANVPDGSLVKLKSFEADTRGQFGRNRYASYEEARGSIIINTSAPQNESAEWETIAHEVGHSLIFSKLTPPELSRVARDFGGWSTEKAPRTFYDKSFFIRFFGADRNASSFPTLYSYTNIHEWLAENFAKYMVGKVNAKKPVNLMLRNFFDKLLL